MYLLFLKNKVYGSPNAGNVLPRHIFALVAKFPHKDVIDVTVDDRSSDTLKDQRHTGLTQAKATNVISHWDRTFFLARTFVGVVEAK